MESEIDFAPLLLVSAFASLGFNTFMPRVWADVIGSALVVGAGRTGADLTPRRTGSLAADGEPVVTEAGSVASSAESPEF